MYRMYQQRDIAHRSGETANDVEAAAAMTQIRLARSSWTNVSAPLWKNLPRPRREEFSRGHFGRDENAGAALFRSATVLWPVPAE